MKSESKDVKKSVSAKKVSLVGVLKKNEKIKDAVKGAANELTTVNEVLKKEKPPAKAVDLVLDKNKVVEQKVAKAAEDLKSVNLKLTKEIAGRIVIESELATTKDDLAEVREDLSKAQLETEVDGDTSDTLFKNADAAMYKTKRTKKRVMLFNESGRKSHA